MILAINCGSSSLKYTLFDWDKYSVILTGSAEKVGNVEKSFINHKKDGQKKKVELPLKDHQVTLEKILSLIEEDGIKKEDISVVAHRFVHGGEKYRKSMIVNEEIVADLEKLNPLAPLHNPANISGIKSVMAAMPWATNTISLDTSFHEALPEQ
ncbi:MAG: acetate kinase, partial [Rickettsiales bacterium]|nr:acetate kinase [Rickettsiales bacterium]